MKKQILQGRRMCFFFFLISVLFISYNAHAVQNDPNVVLDTEWFLHSLTIDGEEIIPPINEEVQFINLFFDQGNPEEEPPFLITSVCNEIISTSGVSSDELLIIAESPSPLIDCQLQENIDFDALYFDFLATTTLFPYELIETGNTLQLILTAPNGDQAIYGNEVLDVEDINRTSFQLYPNPVQDELFIHNLNNLVVDKVSVYDVLGKEVLQVSSQERINMSTLSTGFYFVVITSNQTKTIKKVFVQ